MAVLNIVVKSPLPQALNEKIIHLAILRKRIHESVAAYEELSKEINAMLVEHVEVRK